MMRQDEYPTRTDTCVHDIHQSIFSAAHSPVCVYVEASDGVVTCLLCPPGKRDQEMEREQRRRERLEKEFKEISIKFNQKVRHMCILNKSKTR